MKKLLMTVVGVIVLFGLAFLLLPSLISTEKIKGDLTAEVKAATGRDLSIDGKVSFSVFPALAIRMSDLSLANPPGFRTRYFVRLGGLDVRLKLLPLLAGNVEIDSFILTNPAVALEIDATGRANWLFAPPSVETAPAPSAAAAPAASWMSLTDIQLRDVRLADGVLSYRDDKVGVSEVVDGVNLALSLKNLDSPLVVKGKFVWRGQAVAVGLDIARPRVIVDGSGITPAAVTLTANPLTLSLNGDVVGKDKSFTSALDLAVPSVRGVIAWLNGKTPNVSGDGLGPLSIKGKLSAGGDRLALSQAAITLDATKTTGDLAVDNGGGRPAIKAALTVETLDLTPYLTTADGRGKAGAGSGKADWSDDPIDASALKTVEADLALTVGSVKAGALDVGRSRLGVAVHGGRMTLDVIETLLYKGQGKGRLLVDGTQAGVGVDVAFSLKGLDAYPFLVAATGFEGIEGTGNCDVAISGRGASQRQIVASLGGKGNMSFLNGAVRGINLAAMLRNVTTAFADTGGAQKTDFAELSGTFTMAAGIVSNQDLSMKAPLLRLAAAGTVDLPKRTLSYRIEPKMAATTEGQGGKQNVGGVTVPVIVAGPWEHPSFRPDLAGLVKGKAGQAVQKALEGAIPGRKSGDGMQLPVNPGNIWGR
ncbi:AsmA family protein [Telmatospirillum sp.]|uniref:AsmA family protein n=1 Tax=Telmatospirillum sp. TaxID=2079197 RepID=UPI0028464E33|nr:AsmA family protein [Telmatospirillum sp.]MDR3435149.1 AsmA family protein [Telmatospirillum sp.]